ncbi:hypothetical protein F0562_020280 [Nyssa sinensis]|uniref:Magnesium transporter n=1 Tax=Nyssa sinensis TaxID=561372 RepID=A0A5J5BS82_9ASTE|nr:hypothetical protein F0562_020280 [Nyssa sinensis]
MKIWHNLYLTRKWIQNQQYDALLGAPASNNNINAAPNLRRLSSNKSASLMSSNNLDDHDVEDLEMLLEAYFMQLDGTRNKILSVREYIDDTEDYVNIQLDNQRNELIQLQLTLTSGSFAIAVETLIAGMFDGRSFLDHEFPPLSVSWTFTTAEIRDDPTPITAADHGPHCASAPRRARSPLRPPTMDTTLQKCCLL